MRQMCEVDEDIINDVINTRATAIELPNVSQSVTKKIAQNTTPYAIAPNLNKYDTNGQA